MRTLSTAAGLSALALALTLGGCSGSSTPPAPTPTTLPSPSAAPFSGDPASFTVTSDDVDASGMLSTSIQGRTSVTCYGDGESLHVAWSEPPAGTKSIALMFENLSIPVVYWARVNIDPHQGVIEHDRAGASSGKDLTNDIGVRYAVAPCPDNKVPETYRLTVWALDTELGADVKTYVDLLDVVDGSALATATLEAEGLGVGAPGFED